MTLTVAYMDKLQRQFADDVAFYPTAALTKALDSGHVIHSTENDEPCGYVWFGAIVPGKHTSIFQAAVDYEAQRRHFGWSMVKELMSLVKAGGATGIRTRVASSAESNQFWQEIGFYCTRVTEGGRKRRRKINHYRTDITATLWTPSEFTVEPSDTPIDLTQYNKDKAAGVAMPSRFSRTHYP